MRLRTKPTEPGEYRTEVKITVLAENQTHKVLLATLLSVINQPASMLARLLNEPGASLARVVKAKFDQGD